jgi:type III pantothenate kinase
VGIFEGRRLLKNFSFASKKSYIRRYLKKVEVIIFSSVSPSKEGAFLSEASIIKRKPLKLGKDIKIPIKVEYKDPSEVGTDRLANCVAAYERVRRECIVVDIGTAISFDIVSKGGAFIGGVIAPGPSISSEALHKHCELLPYIREISIPPRTIGKDTRTNILSGIYWGSIGLIERILKNIKDELGGNPSILATGGGVRLLGNSGLFDMVIPVLTLEGIAISYYKSRGL